jgi:hypothetical protein
LLLQKNWNLFSVNVAMAGTGLYQLSRKIRFVKKPRMFPHTLYIRCLIVNDAMAFVDLLCRQDYFSDEKEAVAQLEG